MLYLGSSKLFAVVITIFVLGVVVHQSALALPVNRLKEHDKDTAIEDAQAKQQPFAALPPREDGVLKVKKEEQMENPGKKKSADNEVHMDIDLVKKIGKLPVDKLKPADHVDGVKMEHDGHVNDQYHKEMFLGEAHDEFKSETFEEAEDKLKEIVHKADTDNDGFLSKDEMEQWILINMKKHFAEAEAENDHIFKHLDPDGDGFVKWKEYYVHFLLSRGIEVEKAIEFVKDYDENDEGDEGVDLMLEDKDFLMSYKFKWTDADQSPADNQLSKAEFMVFRHPEHSKNSLQMMVENVLRSVDTNNDGMVSLEEFSALPPGEVEGKEFEEMDRKWQEERRVEFKTVMDINHDGQVTGEELKRYLDPTNPIQAKIETDSLVSLMDDNKDLKLSMAEIMEHSEIFITSKFANFGANVHDEF